MTTVIDPHKTHHYSHDQLTKAIFELELGRLKTDKGHNSEVLGLIECYLKERVDEIKERWK